MEHSTLTDLVRNMRSAFIDAPSLRVRLGQARCLWGASTASCREALRVLVDSGFLARAADGTYVRRGGDGSVVGGPTPPHDAPWDCSWAEPLLVNAPIWLDGWRSQWTCLKEGGPTLLKKEDCDHCPRWEPRRIIRHRDDGFTNA